MYPFFVETVGRWAHVAHALAEIWLWVGDRFERRPAAAAITALVLAALIAATVVLVPG
jgi:preprotein translocase subunit SecF